jgi:hypothetical protein
MRGHSDDALLRRDLVPEGAHVLEKAFRAEDLADAVRETPRRE